MKNKLSIIAGIGCFLALFDMPDEFYKILRFAVVAACGYIIFEIQKSTGTDISKSWTSIGFGLLAVVFNPILPLDMRKSDWVWFNSAGALIFGLVVFENKLKKIPVLFFTKNADIKKNKTRLTLKEKFVLILLLVSIVCLFAIVFYKELKLPEQALVIVAGVFVVSGLLFSIVGLLPEGNDESRKNELYQRLKRLSACTSLEEREQLMKNWGDKWK